MTYTNAVRLLKHYNDLADGTIEAPFGHKDWADVVANAKVRAKKMQERVDWYESDAFRVKHGLPAKEEKKASPVKPQVKSKGAK